MLLHNHRLLLIVMLFVWLVGAAGVPVYAQELPVDSGPPEILTSVITEPEEWAVFECGGYGVQVVMTKADNEFFRWRNEDGEILYSIGTLRENVTLTNTVTGKSVDLILRWGAEFDATAHTWAMTGIRSAVVKPDGELDFANVGQLVLSGDTLEEAMKGDVLNASGRWDAVNDGVFDHRAFPCKLVAD